VDVSRYLEGEPECWYDYDEEIVEGFSRNILRVVYNCSASAGIAPRTLMAKGAAVAALVALMEYSGRGVQLDIADCFVGGATTEFYVTVKRADEDLDVLTIAYAIAHPATARRLMFSVAEQLPSDIRKKLGITPEGSYGYPGEVHDQGDVYIGGSVTGDVRWKDELSAMKWVIRTLKEQGIALKDEAEAVTAVEREGV
ncbi:MAG TPA: hypothetical protein VIU40_12035, partial [Geobacteraceae bacterium]